MKSIAISTGNSLIAHGTTSIAIGNSSRATGISSIAIGNSSFASWDNPIANLPRQRHVYIYAAAYYLTKRGLPIDILNIVAINHSCDIIYEEGTGCRIMFKELDIKTLNEIKKIIVEDLSKNLIDFSDIK